MLTIHNHITGAVGIIAQVAILHQHLDGLRIHRFHEVGAIASGVAELITQAVEQTLTHRPNLLHIHGDAHLGGVNLRRGDEPHSVL